MLRPERGRYGSLLPFIDLLWILVLSMITLLFLAMLLVNPPKTVTQPPRTATYVVKITWQHDSPSDVDLWSREPSGRVIAYMSREGAVAHLERDDLGQSNDTDSNGRPILWNEENLVLRGAEDGWWKVSVHNYAQKSGPDPEVKWEFVRAKNNEIIASGEVKLSETVREQGLMQFRMVEGNVAETSTDKSVLVATPYAVGAYQ